MKNINGFLLNNRQMMTDFPCHFSKYIKKNLNILCLYRRFSGKDFFSRHLRGLSIIQNGIQMYSTWRGAAYFTHNCQTPLVMIHAFHYIHWSSPVVSVENRKQDSKSKTTFWFPNCTFTFHVGVWSYNVLLPKTEWQPSPLAMSM